MNDTTEGVTFFYSFYLWPLLVLGAWQKLHCGGEQECTKVGYRSSTTSFSSWFPLCSPLCHSPFLHLDQVSRVEYQTLLSGWLCVVFQGCVALVVARVKLWFKDLFPVFIKVVYYTVHRLHKFENQYLLTFICVYSTLLSSTSTVESVVPFLPPVELNWAETQVTYLMSFLHACGK